MFFDVLFLNFFRPLRKNNCHKFLVLCLSLFVFVFFVIVFFFLGGGLLE